MTNDHETSPLSRQVSENIRTVHITGYEEAWASYIPHIQTLIGHKMTPAALVNRVREIKFDIRPYSGLISDELLKKIGRHDPGRFANRPAGEHLIVSNGRYVTTGFLSEAPTLADALRRHFTDEIDCVVEFGSGIGDNLAKLAVDGPGHAATFIACEPSPSGRRAAELMFSALPGVRLETRDFDYTAPDLSFLKRFRSVLAFTSHSIEQIPVLGQPFYRQLLDSPVSACVHLEPIGWQRFTNLVKEVQEQYQDAELWQRHRRDYCYTLDDASLVLNAASWAASGFYNTDLLKLIATAAGAGEIAIATLAYEIIGYNPFNPSTLVAWTRRR